MLPRRHKPPSNPLPPQHVPAGQVYGFVHSDQGRGAVTRSTTADSARSTTSSAVTRHHAPGLFPGRMCAGTDTRALVRRAAHLVRCKRTTNLPIAASDRARPQIASVTMAGTDTDSSAGNNNTAHQARHGRCDSVCFRPYRWCAAPPATAGAACATARRRWLKARSSRIAGLFLRVAADVCSCETFIDAQVVHDRV